jgi:hypothetical protein
MLGSVVSGTYIATGNLSGTPKLLSVLTITQPGVYIFSYNALASAQGATFSNFGIWVDDAFDGTNNGNYLAYQQIPYTSVPLTNNTIAANASQIYTLIGTKTFGLFSIATVTAGNVATNSAQFAFRFIRIA